MAKKDNEKWEYLPEGRVRDKETGAEGVIRTIGGRRVFIKDGQDLASAMIESGKFDKSSKTKPGMRESYRKQKEKDYKEQEELYDKYKKANEETSNVQEEANKYMKKVSNNNELYEDTYEKRAEKENRYAKVDAERGETEPLREQYRDKNKYQYPNDSEKYNNYLLNKYGLNGEDDSRAKGHEQELRKEWEEVKNNEEKLKQELSYDKYFDNKEKSTNNKNKSYDVDMSDTTTEEYDKRSKEDTLYGGIPNRDKVLNEKARKDAFDYSREEVTKAYETMRDKMQKHMDNNEDHWSGKEYTNAEFLAHLEDANWHGEMKQLREANLTPEQLTEIKDKTTLSSWGVGSELTGKENVQKMIDSVKNKSTNDELKQNLYRWTDDEGKRIQPSKDFKDLHGGNYVKQNEDGSSTYIATTRQGDGSKNYYRYEYDKGGNVVGGPKTFKSLEEATGQSTNETLNNAIREKASKSNTIPRDYEKIIYTSKIDTIAGKKGDKFELYKDEYGETHTKNLRTGETYQANMSMIRTPEAVEINDVVKKQTSNKILNDSQLRKMKWEDVVKANTDYFSEKSVYDFEGGRQGKYKYEDGWRDNGGAGVIKQSDLDRLIDKEDWERANKGYGRKYDSVDEAIADKDSAINQYIRNKANIKNAYKQYLKDHPNSKMSLSQFKKMNK